MKSLFSTQRRIENLDYEYSNPFFKSVWFKGFEGLAKNEVLLTNSRLTLDEPNNRWVLSTEIPDISRNNLKIHQNKGVISITAEKNMGDDQSSFSKYFRIPEGVNTDFIEAIYENSLLTIHLPLIRKKVSQSINIK